MNFRKNFLVGLTGCLILISFNFPLAYAGNKIENSQPEFGINRVIMKEVWRVGADDAGVIFGMVVQVIPGTDDHILVLDYLQSIVFEFSAEGEVVKEWNVGGDGPGMVNNPVNVFRSRNGNIGLVGMYPGKVEFLSSDFEYISTMKPVDSESGEDSVNYFFDAMAYGEDLLVVGEKTVMNENIYNRESFVAIIDAKGAEKNRLFEQTRVQDWSKFEFIEEEVHQVSFRQVAVRDDGIVFVPTSRNGYEITGFDSLGHVEIMISRQYSPRKRTTAEKKFYAADYSKQAVGAAHPRIQVSNFDPDIEMLRISDDGDLWVVTSSSHESRDNGVFSVIDVFNKEGHFVQQNFICIEGEHSSGRLFWLSDERCVLVTGLKDAIDEFKMMRQEFSEKPRELYELPMEIVFYKIVNGGE